MARDDFEVNAATSAYLEAFDNWLHTVWKQPFPPENEIATALKDECFLDLVGHVDRTIICAKCKMRHVQHRRGPGRPRKHCEVCAPPRRKKR